MSSFLALLRDWGNSLHIPNLLQGFTAGVRATLVPVFARQLGSSEGQIGLIIGSAGVLKVILDVVFGFATNMFGCRRVMAAGMIVNAVASCIAALSLSSVHLVIASMLWGAGVGAFILARQVFIAKAVPRDVRGRLMSIVVGTLRWCSFLGPAIGGVLMDIVGVRFTALSLAPISLGCCYAVMTDGLIQEMDTQLLQEVRNEGGSRGISDVCVAFRRHRDIVMRLGVYSFNMVCIRQARPLLLVLSGMRMGFTPSMVGLLLSSSYMVDALFFFLGGYITDRFGRKYAAIPTSLSLGVAFCVLACSTTTNTLILSGFLFGLADSIGAGVVLTLIADHSPPRGGAHFMGLMRTLQDAGQVIGPIACGIIIEHLSFSWVCYIIGILGFLNGFWAFAMLPEKPQIYCDVDLRVEEDVVVMTVEEFSDEVSTVVATEKEEYSEAKCLSEPDEYTSSLEQTQAQSDRILR